MIKAYLEGGADVNHVNNNKCGAFHFTMRSGSAAITLLLIECKCTQLGDNTSDGMSPLMLGAHNVLHIRLPCYQARTTKQQSINQICTTFHHIQDDCKGGTVVSVNANFHEIFKVIILEWFLL